MIARGIEGGWSVPQGRVAQKGVGGDGNRRACVKGVTQANLSCKRSQKIY
ncbi:MAG: hypothetical protein ACTSYB_15265 [Candidatus Helarchaeota archaeon]